MSAIELFQREQQTGAYPAMKPIVFRAHNEFAADNFMEETVLGQGFQRRFGPL